MSLRAYAKRRGVVVESVSQAVKEERLRESVVRVRGEPKIADPELADREWEANTRPRVDRAAAASPLLEPRRRREQAAAELAELALAQRRGEVILIADARRDVMEKFAIVKARILAVPARAAQRLPHLASAIMPVFTELLHEALEELADNGGA